VSSGNRLGLLNEALGDPIIQRSMQSREVDTRVSRMLIDYQLIFEVLAESKVRLKELSVKARGADGPLPSHPLGSR
jgi:hypothetical protein